MWLHWRCVVQHRGLQRVFKTVRSLLLFNILCDLFASLVANSRREWGEHRRGGAYITDRLFYVTPPHNRQGWEFVFSSFLQSSLFCSGLAKLYVNVFLAWAKKKNTQKRDIKFTGSNGMKCRISRPWTHHGQADITPGEPSFRNTSPVGASRFLKQWNHIYHFTVTALAQLW